MTEFVHLELLPLGQVLRVKRGAALQDLLFAHGVEFPCGGRGRCKGCKIKVLEGHLPLTEEDRQKLTPEELAAGWRLACRARADADLKIELAQWEATILTDDSVFAFTPQDGLGVAVDLGTTTIVAQLLDLQTGLVLAVRAALNAQAKHGADIMSRIEFAVASHGQRTLEKLVRDQIGRLIGELLAEATERRSPTRRAEAVGAQTPPLPELIPTAAQSGSLRSAQTHRPGRQHGDAPPVLRAQPRTALALPVRAGVPRAAGPFRRRSGLAVAGQSNHPLPALPGGFVGSDILAGVLATKLHESQPLAALLDLGTNGEIVVGNRERLLCASTAAGPAFEGARIAMGMRAATGAIAEVRIENGRLRCHTLGNARPRGLCGSGLVDAVAAGLDLGWIRANGRLAQGESLLLAPPVALNQRDVRELQLAKGAIAAGLRLLLEQWGASPDDLARVYLAGAFGNYINQASARRIGLLDLPAEKVQPAGNTALLGAKLALFSLHEHDGAYPEILARTRHVALNEDPRFQETFVEEMGFPDG